MKKTLAKILALALCAVLLVTGTVFVTLAYLQDSTKVLRNTFTSANVKIKLTERELAENGMNVLENRVEVQERAYRLIPGKEYTKDPTITVIAGSESCYIFFAMKNTMLTAETGVESKENGYISIAQQIANNGWKPLAGGVNDDERSYDIDSKILGAAGVTWGDDEYMIYYKNEIIEKIEDPALAKDRDFIIFESFTVNQDLKDGIKTWNDVDGDGEKDEGEEDLVIEIIAFAVQSEGFGNVAGDFEAKAGAAFRSAFTEAPNAERD